jgi:hypothetical protein
MNARTMLTALVLAASASTFSPVAAAAPNAQIVNSNVNCRAHPPQFGASTIFTFDLKIGDVLAVIPANTRVQALSKVVVANRDEWYEVKTLTNVACWIYAGTRGNLRYLRLDSGIVIGQAQGSTQTTPASILRFMPLGAAHAQADAARVAVEPTVSVKPLFNLVVAAIGVAIFVAALACIRKYVFPTSPLLLMASGLSVLLILGTLSETTFASMLTQLLAKG